MVIEACEVLLVAWHHAVWRTSAGDLVDLSEHPFTGTVEAITTFIEDPCQHYDLTWPPAFPQVFEILANHPAVLEFVDAYAQMYVLQRSKLEELKRIPGAVYLENGTTWVSPSDRTGMIELQRLNHEYDSLIEDRARAQSALLPVLAAIQRQRQANGRGLR